MRSHLASYSEVTNAERLASCFYIGRRRQLTLDMCSSTHELSDRNVDGFSQASHLALGASRKATGGSVARVVASPFLPAIEGNPICEPWYGRILTFSAPRLSTANGVPCH